MCIQLLVNHVSRSGNLLLNVGPTSRGTFDERALERLAGIGKWMKANGRSIYGCGSAPEEFPVPPDCRYTWNPETNRLYLHCFAWPFKHVILHNLAGKVKYAQLLHDMSEVLRDEASAAITGKAATGVGNISLKLPVQKPDDVVPVVEIILNEPLV